MSTVKITELPEINHLNTDTNQTLALGVDLLSGVTGKMTLKTLAEGLFSNDALKVGNNQILFDNTVGQFSGNSSTFLQVNLQNFNNTGSADFVAATKDSNNANSYIDMGINNPDFSDAAYSAMKPYDGYLYSYGRTYSNETGNLIIGTASTLANIVFIAGGTVSSNIVAKITKNGLTLENSANIRFSDGTIQRTNAASWNYSNATYAFANTISSNTLLIQAVDVSQNTRMSLIEAVDVSQNTRMTFNEAVDASQNSRMDLIETINSSQNSTISSIQTLNTTQDNRLTLIEAVDVYQNNSIALIQGGLDRANANIASIIQGVDLSQNTRMTAIESVDLTQNTWISSNSVYSQAAFSKANNALANTTGTFNGTLTFTGEITSANSYITNRLTFTNNGLIRTTSGVGNDNDLIILTGDELSSGNGGILNIQTGGAPINHWGGDINVIPGLGGQGRGTINLMGPVRANALVSFNSVAVNGTMILANSNFSAIESAMTISASATIATPSNDGYMLHISGKNGVPSRIVTDSYGTGAYSLLAGRAARGTVTSPTALQSGDVIARFSGNGYGTTKYQTLGVARIDFVAAQNYTDADTASQIQFWNCPNNSNTLTNIATFNGDSATFTGVVNPTKGFIYTPLVYPSTQTAITIDFANNSMVRAQTSTGLVVSMTNYTVGKVVELWITNLAGSNQTFTTGVPAINSTINATTYNIPSTSTICAKYFCVDGTLANTLVSVIHA